MKLSNLKPLRMNMAVLSSFYFRSRNWNLPSSLDTHHPQNESRKGCKNLRGNPGEPGLVSNYDYYCSQHRSDSIDFASKDQRNLRGQDISHHTTPHTSKNAEQGCRSRTQSSIEGDDRPGNCEDAEPYCVEGRYERSMIRDSIVPDED